MPPFQERVFWYGVTLITVGLTAMLTPQLARFQRTLGGGLTVAGLLTLVYVERDGIRTVLRFTYVYVGGVSYPRASLVIVTVIGCIVGGFVFGGTWWLASKDTASPSPSIRPITLKDLFENDWPDLPAYYTTSILGVSESSRDITLAWRLNGDFAARSKFLAFFLEPTLAPQDAIDICVLIANDYQQFIDSTNAQVDIAGKWPTDTSATHLKDMEFSKRIFIYYRNSDFSVAQMGSLEVLYVQKGLSIQFRGADYEWLHRNDHTTLRPEPLTPGAVLLPRALGTGLEIKVTKLSP